MAFDGSGTYNRTHNWQQDAANAINISAPEMDAEDNSIAGAFNNTVTRDGQGKMTADFLPATDNTLNLGSALKRWASINGVPIPSSTVPWNFFPQTPAEATAGVTPTFYFYPPGNALRYNADPTGVATSSAAMLSTLKVAGGGGIGTIPPGTYLCSTPVAYTLPSATASLSLIGSGAEATQLKFTTSGGSGITINYVGQFNSVHVHDLCFLTTSATGSGNGLALVQTAASIPNPANSAQSDITNCVFRGADAYAASNYWGACLQVNGVSNVNYTNDTFTSNTTSLGIGVQLLGAAAAVSGVHDFSGCTFNYTLYGILNGSYVQGVSALNCNFTGGQFGIICQTGAVGTDQLSVAGCQFENSVVGIFLQGALPGFTVTDSIFIVGLVGTAAGIDMRAAELFSITGCTFSPVSGPASTTGIAVAGTISTLGGTITGNTIYSMATGLLLGATSNNVNVQANNFVSCTSAIANLGTNNVIANNPGYNPAGNTGGVVVGASPATITNGASPGTYYFSQSATFTATVTISGFVLGTLSSGNVVAISLGPNEACVVNWTTTAPTYFRQLH